MKHKHTLSGPIMEVKLEHIEMWLSYGWDWGQGLGQPGSLQHLKRQRKHMINTRRVYGFLLLFTVSHKVMVQSNRTDQSECIERQIKMVSK